VIETINFDMVFSFSLMISFLFIYFAVNKALFQQQGNAYREVIMYIVKNGLWCISIKCPNYTTGYYIKNSCNMRIYKSCLWSNRKHLQRSFTVIIASFWNCFIKFSFFTLEIHSFERQLDRYGSFVQIRESIWRIWRINHQCHHKSILPECKTQSLRKKITWFCVWSLWLIVSESMGDSPLQRCTFGIQILTGNFTSLG